MKSTITLLASVIMFYSCAPTESEQESTEVNFAFSADNEGLKLPDGFKAVLVTDTTGRGRHMAVNENGDIYLRLRNLTDKGGIVALRDTNGDGKADQKEYFGDVAGTGLEIKDNYLYFSSDTSIHRYQLDPSNLVPSGDYETIVSGFRYETQHAVKPFAFDAKDKMYVNIGAPSNACQEEDRTEGSPGMDPCPILENYGGIWQFDANRVGQTYEADGYRYATGLRNCVAINWNLIADKLYVVQHGRDMLHNWWPEIYTEEVPAEEFFMVNDGSDFGWPYCYFDGMRDKKVLGPEYGGNGEDQGRCVDVDGPIMVFPAHYGPNDVLFYSGDQFPEKYKNGAFIAFHGSWNREADHRQKGYNIVFVPFSGDKPSGDWEVFADGFEGPEDVITPRNAIHRPTGLAQGPDGSLYISDSVKGAIYRIVYTGEQS